MTETLVETDLEPQRRAIQDELNGLYDAGGPNSAMKLVIRDRDKLWTAQYRLRELRRILGGMTAHDRAMIDNGQLVQAGVGFRETVDLIDQHATTNSFYKKSQTRILDIEKRMRGLDIDEHNAFAEAANSYRGLPFDEDGGEATRAIRAMNHNH